MGDDLLAKNTSSPPENLDSSSTHAVLAAPSGPAGLNGPSVTLHAPFQTGSLSSVAFPPSPAPSDSLPPSPAPPKGPLRTPKGILTLGKLPSSRPSPFSVPPGSKTSVQTHLSFRSLSGGLSAPISGSCPISHVGSASVDRKEHPALIGKQQTHDSVSFVDRVQDNGATPHRVFSSPPASPPFSPVSFSDSPTRVSLPSLFLDPSFDVFSCGFGDVLESKRRGLLVADSAGNFSSRSKSSEYNNLPFMSNTADPILNMPVPGPNMSDVPVPGPVKFPGSNVFNLPSPCVFSPPVLASPTSLALSPGPSEPSVLNLPNPANAVSVPTFNTASAGTSGLFPKPGQVNPPAGVTSMSKIHKSGTAAVTVNPPADPTNKSIINKSGTAATTAPGSKAFGFPGPRPRWEDVDDSAEFPPLAHSYAAALKGTHSWPYPSSSSCSMCSAHRVLAQRVPIFRVPALQVPALR